MKSAHMTGKAAIVAALLGIAAASASAKEWVVGHVGPFTVLPVPDAIQVGEGAAAFFAAQNERGGINGERIDFFQLDDAYNPEKFKERFQEAMARQPVALLSPLGSASVKRMLDDKLLDGADTVVLNAIPGAEALRKPGHSKLFHLRAGDRQQIEKIIRHVETLGHKRLGVIHQDIPMGTSGASMALEAVKQTGNLQLTVTAASTDGVALRKAAAALSQAGVQSVLLVGSPKFSADAVAALRAGGLNQPMFALSYLLASDLVRVAGAGARGVGIAQAMPNPMGKVLPLQREFHAAMRKRFPNVQQYSVFHLEGYITAKVFYEVASRTKDRSPAEFSRTLRKLGEVDLGGYRVDFSKGNEGSRYVDIGVIDERGRLLY
jgi:ABC-type branched-subunit amino acid transport system substrate-binding protein